jgi:hypothetical protein
MRYLALYVALNELSFSGDWKGNSVERLTPPFWIEIEEGWDD